MIRFRPVRLSIAPLLFTLALASAISWGGSPAHAQEVSAENKAAARDLATEGINLAQAGKCEEAIPKLLRAEKLYHAPTILTWIGQCQLEVGRYVEGTETLNRVIREKIERNAPEAYVNAQARARELVAQAKPKIGKLVIDVLPENVDGLTVTVGGQPMSSALVGAPRPTDPGEHVIEVSAPGYKTQTQEIVLGEGASEEVNFKLEADGATTAVAQDSTPGARSDQNKSPSRVLGWATVGVGGALMAGGGVMGYLALSKKNDLSCGDSRSCPPSEEDNLNAARTSATVSTVLFGVGGAVAVTGLVLVLTGKSKSEAAEISSRKLATPGVRPYVGLGSLGVDGRF